MNSILLKSYFFSFRKAILIITICFSFQYSYARVFSFQDNWVAAYFRATGGASQLGDNAYADTSGTLTFFNDEVPYNFSGELGFAFLFSETFAMRVGIESITSKNISAEGKNIGGTKQMNVDSGVNVFNPQITLEFVVKNIEDAKLYFYAGVGQATAKVANEYDLNATGLSAYTGSSDFQESFETEVISYHAGMNYEMHLVDNVTLQLELGYRHIPLTDFKQRDDVLTLRGGGTVTPVSAGDTVYKNSGEKLEIDMSGAYVGIGFRFYIPPLN